MSRSKKLVVVIMGAVAALAVGSFALAAVPDAGVVHGCYKKDSGALRVYDPATNQPKACTDKEAPLDWSQQGPKGDSGLGKAFTRDWGFAQIPAGISTTVATRTVPAGTYVLSAKLNLEAAGLNVPPSIVGCSLGASGANGGSADYAYGTVSSNATGDVLVSTITLQNNNTSILANGGTVSVTCQSPQPAEAHQVKITALQVQSIDYQ